MTDQPTFFGADPLTEFLQLQALTLTVKALVSTHPKPDDLAYAMSNLFAQYQVSQVFLALSESQRLWMRQVFSDLLSDLKSPGPSQPSGAPPS
jgi:hypothetical protein